MATFEEFMRGRFDFNQVAMDQRYVGAHRDPCADPPDMAGLRLTYTPAADEEDRP